MVSVAPAGSALTRVGLALTRSTVRLHAEGPRSAEQAWLDDGLGAAAHQQLLVPYDAAAMREYVISKRVNSPAHNDADVLTPAE